MAEWVLIPSLKTLRAEFDRIAPNRDTSSDGSIGDPAHQGSSSDHNPDETGKTPDEDSDTINEVHAIDVDKDLRRDNVTMEKVVDFLIAECRKSNGKDKGRFKYIIYDERIWEAPNWEERPYTGSNPHTGHGHFSGEYDSKYSQDTSSFGLVEEFGEDDMTEAQFKEWWNKCAEEFFKRDTTKDANGTTTNITSRIGRDGLDQFIPNGTNGDEKTHAWAAIRDLGRMCVVIETGIDELKSDLADLKEVLNAHISGIIEGEQ